MLTEFPQGYADAFAAGVGLMFLALVWASCVGFVIRVLTRLAALR